MSDLAHLGAPSRFTLVTGAHVSYLISVATERRTTGDKKMTDLIITRNSFGFFSINAANGHNYGDHYASRADAEAHASVIAASAVALDGLIAALASSTYDPDTAPTVDLFAILDAD